MTNTMKLTSRHTRLKLSNCHFICHDSAMGAWRTWKRIDFHSAKLPNSPQMIQAIVDAIPVNVVMNSKGKYEFFSGFSSPVLNDSTAEYANVVIYKGIDSDNIKAIAWANLFSLLNFSLDSHSGLASAYEVINKNIPENICRQLFNRKNLSIETLAEITGVTGSAIKWQLGKIRRSQSKMTMLDDSGFVKL